jgi:FtsP/CotA-like multicopper oxidase with cupredoxin domain
MSDDFGNFMDRSHNGRVGYTLTVNGRILRTFPVRAGEHVRLLLINAAKARIFGLEFQDHQPAVIALDGQPVEPHEPAGGRLVLGPAMRADLVIDMRGKPASGSQPPIRSTAASSIACSTSSMTVRLRCASTRSMRRYALPPIPCRSSTSERLSDTR